MTIEEMKKKKREYGYTYEQIALLSGVPIGTVQKVFGGITHSPRKETLFALYNMFSNLEKRHSIDHVTPCNMIGEAATPYFGKAQGTYTVDDFFALPEDCHVELIDGVIYDMATPSSVHQMLVGEIYLQLRLYVKEKGGSCLPFLSPIGVQLDCNDKTMVEPDVLVVCNRDQVRNRNVYGAPDFIVEVLSPSNRHKDVILKLNKYHHAGVREFWQVDPKKQVVLVYDFKSDNYPAIYGFQSDIPVSIWNGDCKIQLQEFLETARFLYDE